MMWILEETGVKFQRLTRDTMKIYAGYKDSLYLWLTSLKQEKKKLKRKASGTGFKDHESGNLKIGDITFITRTLATEEFVANFNFHLVGSSIMDPYITENITSTASLLIYTFNAADEVVLAHKGGIFQSCRFLRNSS